MCQVNNSEREFSTREEFLTGFDWPSVLVLFRWTNYNIYILYYGH